MKLIIIILTFLVVFLFGITIGIFIYNFLKNKINKDFNDKTKYHYSFKDDNGNMVRIPVQNITLDVKEKRFIDVSKTKIKLNKYEMDYLIKNIEMHLNNIGETSEENEYVKDLYENLIKKGNGKTK
tara:strand:- start:2454 stop:2831 length:378 start_codon:yes stop_codon:yes gene_type:complete